MQNNKEQEKKIIDDITCLFWELCEKNSNSPNINFPPTIYHSVVVPPILFQTYVKVLFKKFNFELKTIIIAFIFMSKYFKKNKLSPVKHMVHRLFLVSLLVANKISDDIFYNNYTIGVFGGIKLEEMNFLENSFIKNLDYAFWVNLEEYNEFLNNINMDYFEKIFNHYMINDSN